MLIDPRGLLYGERIGACSDDAQLHFPRLMAASNGYGRIEMSYSNLVQTVYAHFAVKPTKEQLQGWFREYHLHFLLFAYRTTAGATWGQWDVPKKMLPRYKTAEDNRSPAPPEAEYAAYQQQHVASKRTKYLTSEDSLSISEDFGKVLKPSEASGTFPPGIGTGIGIGEEQKQASPSAPRVLTGRTKYTEADVLSIWGMWPVTGGKKEGLESIRKALAQRSQSGVENPVEDLKARVRTWLAWHARKEASGGFVASIGMAQGWFGDRKRRYLDDEATPPPETLLQVEGAVVPQSSVEAQGVAGHARCRMMFTFDQAQAYFAYRITDGKVPHRGTFSARCPFHDDRTASMSVNLDRGGIWACHACNIGGGIYDFEKTMFPGRSNDELWESIYKITGAKPTAQGKYVPKGPVIATYEYVAPRRHAPLRETASRA